MGKVKLSAMVLIGLILLSGCQPKPVQPPANTNQPTLPAPPPTVPSPPPAPALPVGVSISNMAPDFNLRTFTGDNISLSDFRGRPVLLNFWATWCGPCKFEMPFLQKINDSYSAKGLVVLAVDFGEKPAKIQEFMTKNNITLTMPMPMDTDGKVTTKTYLVGALPTTFLIDKDGVIRSKVVGAFANVEAIENELKKIMP